MERARPKRLRFRVFAMAATLVSDARPLIVRVELRLEEFVVHLSEVRVRLWQKTPVCEQAMVCTDSS
jgi:hypothetical protein